LRRAHFPIPARYRPTDAATGFVESNVGYTETAIEEVRRSGIL